MPRIRTVKPELFLHEEIFDLEQETGLPIRLAFIGLFTCCDREGRFKWRPRTLKASIFPFDEIDFSRVLDALATRGFIKKYAIDSRDFGFIPSFLTHQVINNRESESVLPEPNTEAIIDATATREPRVDHADTGERKGRERKGRERKEIARASADAKPSVVAESFERFWQAWPQSSRKVAKKQCMKTWERRKLYEIESQIVSHVEAMKKTKSWIDGYDPQPSTYLNQDRWEAPVPDSRSVPAQSLYEQNMAAAQRAKALIFGDDDEGVIEHE